MSAGTGRSFAGKKGYLMSTTNHNNRKESKRSKNSIISADGNFFTINDDIIRKAIGMD